LQILVDYIKTTTKIKGSTKNTGVYCDHTVHFSTDFKFMVG